MNCSSCSYLKEDKKVKGAVDGYLYFCTKIGNYVNGTNNKCSSFEKSYCRKSYINDRIYNDGKNYYNDSTPIEVYVVILIILSIIAFIVNI